MKKTFLTLALIFLGTSMFSQTNNVTVQKNDQGMKLVVNGKDFIINGMNWDYVPIGSTITDPGIWNRSDDVIMSALDAEMSLLKNMGVNAIRTYGLKPKWITYIYENYGIYTMLNITFGAYGLTINGAWTPQTDYADPATRKVLMAEAVEMANTYKGTPGLLLYMIGNENNYHLSWTGAETEAIPIEGIDSNKIKSARALYKAFNDATIEVKKIDNSVPVAICNGDLLYIDLVKEECKDVDIYGTNMYRGISFGDAFQRIKDELDMPVLFAEFGADAFNARDNQEDQYSQVYYNLGNWKEIYANAAGLGKAENSLGGFTFQFSDGWWKYKQTKNLEVHDNVAVWPNGGYSRDQKESTDLNMNEEWFGICAKGPTNKKGLYTLYPRAAYYALKEAHQINPYSKGVTADLISKHFSEINLSEALLKSTKK
jgi:beta-galactosidase/beta-glucuronidase